MEKESVELERIDKKALLSLIREDLGKWEKNVTEAMRIKEEKEKDAKHVKLFTWVGGGAGGLTSAVGGAAGNAATGGIGGVIVIGALGLKGVLYDDLDELGKTIKACNTYQSIAVLEISNFGSYKYSTVTDIKDEDVKQIQKDYKSTVLRLNDAAKGCLY